MAKIYGNTTTTPINPDLFGGGGGADLSDVAPAIQNTISGGDKSLTVNDVSPLVHKCSLRLTSDTYESIVSGSNNIFDVSTLSVGMFNETSAPNLIIDNGANGSFTVSGKIPPYDTLCCSGIIENLTKGTTYTFSIRNSKGQVGGVHLIKFTANYDFIDEVDVSNPYTFIFGEEDVEIYRFICWIPKYDDGETEYELEETTYYIQLEEGSQMTDWVPTGNQIENFSEVTVYVNGKTYTPTADGTVTDIASVSPTMEITTDNKHVNICDFTYCADTKKYIDNGRPYELIDTITTTEDVNEISFSIEPNGTPYNFEKVLIAMVTKQTAKTSTYNVYFNGEYAACFQNALSSSWNAHSVVELWVDKQLDKVRGRYSNHTNDWRNPNYSNVNMLFMLPKVVTSIKSIKLNCGDTVTPTGSTFEIWGVRA